MTRVFFSYSHKDEKLRDRLEVHLANLKRSGRIQAWHDRRIHPGDAFDDQIDVNLEQADIILLLVSPDFIGSRYCYEIEMTRAIERHEAGEARVIPVILNYCDWKETPFAKLQALPKDAQPIVSWANLDEAFLNVIEGIKRVLPAREAGEVPAPAPSRTPLPLAAPGGIRSANLRVKRRFTDADRESFLHESFDYIKRFFRGSLDELSARHAHIDSRFREINADTFTVVIFENGERVAECRIRLGGSFGRGITYACNADAGDNSMNEQVSVEDDEVSLYLKPMGMMMHVPGADRDGKLTQEGAAEFFWAALISPLQ